MLVAGNGNADFGLILKSTNATCDLDPFPTRLLKHCIDDLIVPITAIINLSMRDGVVPHDFKQALVNLLVKKKTLCKNEFKNYRPISNLGFLSKILEKIVAKRLNAHVGPRRTTVIERRTICLYWNGHNLFVHQLLVFVIHSGCPTSRLR